VPNLASPGAHCRCDRLSAFAASSVVTVDLCQNATCVIGLLSANMSGPNGVTADVGKGLEFLRVCDSRR